MDESPVASPKCLWKTPKSKMRGFLRRGRTIFLFGGDHVFGVREFARTRGAWPTRARAPSACEGGRKKRPALPDRHLTPYEFICRAWTTEPKRFILNPLHEMPGLNIRDRL